MTRPPNPLNLSFKAKVWLHPVRSSNTVGLYLFKGGLHMSEILYQVKIADATGHTVAQMTKPEIVAKATEGQGTWVFVNDRLISVEELKGTAFEATDEFKLMPGLVGGVDRKYTVEIADSTGHTSVQMTQAEIAEQASESNGAWVFVDNTMVAAADIAVMDFSDVQKVRMVPPLVGGAPVKAY